MGYICCLGGFTEPSKSLRGKYEPSEKFRRQKQTLFLIKIVQIVYCGTFSVVILPRWPNETHYIEILRRGSTEQKAGAPDVHEVVSEAKAVASLHEPGSLVASLHEPGSLGSKSQIMMRN
jgi:hypothetical protein